MTELEGERAKRQIGFRLSVAKGVSAKADPAKMTEALRYFIKDAIARSPKGKDVQVEVVRQGDSVFYRLVREGEPISAEALSALETGSAAMTHERNLGLALAICRTVVELHGGTVVRENSLAGKVSLALKLPAA